MQYWDLLQPPQQRQLAETSNKNFSQLTNGATVKAETAASDSALSLQSNKAMRRRRCTCSAIACAGPYCMHRNEITHIIFGNRYSHLIYTHPHEIARHIIDLSLVNANALSTRKIRDTKHVAKILPLA